MPPDSVDDTIRKTLDIRLMQEMPVWEYLGLEGPEFPWQEELISVCYGGNAPCMLVPLPNIAYPSGTPTSLKAAMKATQKTWKGARKLLLARMKSKTKIKGLDVGLAITKTGLRPVYAVHDPTHMPAHIKKKGGKNKPGQGHRGGHPHP